MMSISVGFLGSEGSYTNKAATNFFGRIPYSSAIDYRPATSFKTIFQQVGTGELSYGVIPVESSNHGTLPMYLESLLKYSDNIRILGETIEREYHCLCARPGASESSISRIMSHPTILEDCSCFIDAMGARAGRTIEIFACGDSAAACKQLCADDASVSTAVICSPEAASLYGLTVLSQSIGNDRNSETRYIVIANTATDNLNISQQTRNPNDKVRGSLTLSIKNGHGSMFKMISCFSLRDINILKIESRPSSVAIGLGDTVGSVFRHWDMIFFIDYEVSDNESTNRALLTNLEEYCDWVRVLGEYKQFAQQYATVTDVADWKSLIDILTTA